MLAWVAVWNGYPLIFSDSMRYLNGGILRYVPSEAPIFYGAFMIPLHLDGVSLWPVVAAQCLLLSYSVVAVLRALDLFEPLSFVAVMAFIAALTSAPWFAAFIMPDVFTPVVVLAMFALYRGWDRFNRPERLFLVGLALLGVASHISHIVLGIGLAVLFLALGLLRHTAPPRALVTLLIVPPAALAAVVACNVASKGRPVVSRNGSVFLLARAFADGPAADYMRDHCAERSWKLCTVMSRLPRDSELFLWDTHSVWSLGISGDDVQAEASDIVSGTIREYPVRMGLLAAGNALAQLLTFRAGVDFKRWPAVDGVLTVTAVIHRFFPQEFQQLMQSRQQTARLETTVPNILYGATVLLSAVGLVVLLIRLRDPDITELAAVVAVALALNAAATAPFSVVADRYQARIVWLLPLAFAVSLLALQRCRLVRPLAADRSLENSP